ncbi:LemA family protein [Patescibacteria group bacterium]|nr:LemA family protein [Patescibacteria group bacterium]
MGITTILLIVAAVVVLAIIFIYNSLVRLKNRTDEAWSDIDVQTKRRYDLIPNLIDTVKGYAKHEKSLFEKVTKARGEAMNAQGPAEQGKAENVLTGALKSVFAVAENYPQLRATENFQKLQDELSDTENKIMAARRFYNANVRDLNTKIETFPTNFFNQLLKFQKREFFELDDAEAAEAKQPPKADF